MGVGVGGGAHGSCEAAGCHVPVVEVSCCGEEVMETAPEPIGADDPYCQMSEGPCRCGAERGPAPERLPDAPLPRIDRDMVFEIMTGPRVLYRVPDPDRAWRSTGSHFGGCRVGLTHNEFQAFLGVWRT